MEEFKEIISLKDASAASGYTTDYLGYLIRTGKLPGRKMGRNWVTTKKDLEQYLGSNKFHAVTKLFSYCFTIKFMWYVSLAVIAILLYIIYFQPFSGVSSKTAPENPQEQSPEIDQDLHL